MSPAFLSSLHNPPGLFLRLTGAQHRGQVPGIRTAGAKFLGAVQGADPWTELELYVLPKQSYMPGAVCGSELLMQAEH